MKHLLLFIIIASTILATEISTKLDTSIKVPITTNSSTKISKSILIEGVREDTIVIQAIWFEEQSDFINSAKLYAKLYNATGKKEYLFKEVSSRIYSGDKVEESLEKLKQWSSSHPSDLVGKRLLIALYLQEKAYSEAKMLGATLIEASDSEEDLELVATSYFYENEYEKGIELLDELYRKTKNEKVLLRIVAIMTQYMDKNSDAIRLLETHRRMDNPSSDAYKMLIDLYVKEKNLKKILEIYEALYEKEPNEEYQRRIIEIYVYQRDFKGVIKFLESYEGNEEILYDLYKKEQLYEKAIELAKDFYKDSEDPKWLAELAVLVYESANDKNDKKMLKNMVELFDKAISLGVDDSVYLNYYGYTLIDKEIDIDKGMEIISNALKQQPDNSYYLDSMAWAYYKKRECQKAYKMMKQVVEQEGLEEVEIKEHWDKIQECMKSTFISTNG
jgi:predicted Zn-dependent protease